MCPRPEKAANDRDVDHDLAALKLQRRAGAGYQGPPRNVFHRFDVTALHQRLRDGAGNRACEHVARCWADASLQDIATNGNPSLPATTAPKTKHAPISFSLRLLMWPKL